MIGQVLTTSEWRKARELSIEQFTQGELDNRYMTQDTRPRRNLLIGKRLELARIALGKADAQGEFSSAAGIKANTYSMWEIGENFPGIENALKLCSRYPGLSLDWIYLGKLEGMPLWLANTISALMTAEAARDEPEPPKAAPAPLPVRMTKVVKVPARRQRA